ncbi:hypothetical protein OIU74_004375 [Salix koriyanagi]|uniref:Uncharacterized protein n=1 Tax=Salix koriyanagi TaxID=2511006 RepID=A0A9Q0ZM95_9ROSI|nr:hypothetical protein OIU74_004375 [Salix koriyanagi]
MCFVIRAYALSLFVSTNLGIVLYD